MPSIQTSKNSVSVIHQLQHAAQQYRIITTDEEIILRTGEQIVRACQLQISANAWAQNFHLMLEHVARWCEERKGKIALALVELRSGKVVFYFIPKSEFFDFGLADDEADLDIFLNTRGAIGYAESRQIPGWEIDRFVSSEAFRVWPQG